MTFCKLLVCPGRDGHPQAGAGVPAAFAAIAEMLIRYGALPFEAIAEPAYALARDGFPAHEGLLYMPNFSIQENKDHFLNQWPHSAKLYLNSDRSVPQPGRRIQNPAFADVLNTLMETARQDLAQFRTRFEKPVSATFYQISLQSP